MLQIGKMNELTITASNSIGYLLDGGNREVLLPKRGLTSPLKKGEKVTVFVYNDQKESLKATVKRPLALLDDFAILTVRDVTSFGMFLDWGIQKDLFVPSKNLKREYEIGEYALVKLILDFEETGILGTTYVEDHISYEPKGLERGSEVSLLVIGISKLGVNVIINDLHRGIVFNSDILNSLKRGDHIKGYVKLIREDGKIDCTLKPIGFRSAVTENQQIILKALERNGGELYLHDKSSADAIRHELNMSKKQFKAAVGTLYKMRRIKILQNRIELFKRQ